MNPVTVKNLCSALEAFLLEVFGTSTTTVPNPFVSKDIPTGIVMIDGDIATATYKGQLLTPAQRDWLYLSLYNRLPGGNIFDPVPTPEQVDELYKKAAFPA